MTASRPMDDELLMAYADGELDAAQSEAVERAIAGDPDLAARVERQRALRARLHTGLQAELDEPVPERLAALLVDRPTPAQAIDLAAVRARREAARPRQLSWWQLGGMAASVLVGVLLARAWPDRDAAPFAQGPSGLVATGAVDQALSNRLAGDVAGSMVAVPLSFVDKSGSYCRAFVLARSAGLACREGDAWVVQSLVGVEAAPVAGPMRQAASALPPALLSSIDARIDGAALDAPAERAARDRGWRR